MDVKTRSQTQFQRRSYNFTVHYLVKLVTSTCPCNYFFQGVIKVNRFFFYSAGHAVYCLISPRGGGGGELFNEFGSNFRLYHTIK